MVRRVSVTRSIDPSVPRNADLRDFAAGSAHVLSCEMLVENAPPQRGEVVMLDLLTSGDKDGHLRVPIGFAEILPGRDAGEPVRLEINPRRSRGGRDV